MKVISLTYEYLPIGGGGSRVAAAVNEELVRNGDEVRVLTSAMKGLPQQERLNGVEIHRASCVRRHVHYTTAAELLTTLLPAEVVPLIEATMRTAHTDVPRALEHGARVIVSPTTRLYFDRPHADEGADEEQEARRTRLGLPFYPPTSLRDMVEWDPIAETPGVTHADQLAGVEAAVWCETVANRDDLEALLLPRLPGAAERAWASAPTVWDDYVARLAAQTPIWDRRGWAWFRPAFLAADLAAV